MTDILFTLAAAVLAGLALFFGGRKSERKRAARKANAAYAARKKDIEDALRTGGNPAADRDFLRTRSKR